MVGSKVRALLGGAVVLSGMFGVAAAAGASPTSSKFQQAQQALEQQLADRVTQLSHLVSDVAGASALTTQDRNILNARLSTEQADINALVAKVPNDTTFAELNADRSAMYKDNRVYAVMTPQIFVSIGADNAAAQAATLTNNEATLSSEVASLAGLPGYQNAVNHYNNYVKRLDHVTTNMADVSARVLAQTPQGWPHNTHVFVNGNHEVLNANISIAYATYDASVIAMAAGGYTGS
jgi:hypothetical protein